MKKMICLLAACMACLAFSGCATTKSTLATPPFDNTGSIVMATGSATGKTPYQAGREAALALQKGMNGTAPHIVLMTGAYENLSEKKQVVKGIASVFPKDIICGHASYGSFTQDGAVDVDAVSVAGIGGTGISVTAVLEENMGAEGLSLETQKDQLAKCLTDAGARLAGRIPNISKGSLLLLLADAHSPKNQFVIDGIQSITGKTLPITGGSANKNAGQTYIYYRGGMYNDCALGVLLAGNFKVTQTGRQAKSNDEVIATAKEGSAAALNKAGSSPFAVFAFNCAGRKGKLKNVGDELSAIQSSLGKDVPIYGCYCAGEFGPADKAENRNDVTPAGCGWHVMFTLLNK